jgi:hypothetical protein
MSRLATGLLEASSLVMTPELSLMAMYDDLSGRSRPAKRSSSVSFLIAILALHRRDYGPTHEIPDTPYPLWLHNSRAYRQLPPVGPHRLCLPTDSKLPEDVVPVEVSAARTQPRPYDLAGEDPVDARSADLEPLGNLRCPQPLSFQRSDVRSFNRRWAALVDPLGLGGCNTLHLPLTP